MNLKTHISDECEAWKVFRSYSTAKKREIVMRHLQALTFEVVCLAVLMAVLFTVLVAYGELAVWRAAIICLGPFGFYSAHLYGCVVLEPLADVIAARKLCERYGNAVASELLRDG